MCILVILLDISRVHADSRFFDYLLGAEEPPPSMNGESSLSAEAPMTTHAPQEALLAVEAAFIREGFQNVELLIDEPIHTLRLHIYHPRISDLDRLIGRSARIANALLPRTVTQFEFCVLNRGRLCSQCYSLPRYKADRYFRKLISRWQLSQSLQERGCAVEEGMIHFGERLKASSDKKLKKSREDSSVTGETTEYQEVALSRLVVQANNGSYESKGGHVKSPIQVSKQDHKGRPVSASHVDNDFLSGYTLWQNNRFSLRMNPMALASIQGDQQGDAYLDIHSTLTGEYFLFTGVSADFRLFYRWLTPDIPPADETQSPLPPVRSNIDLYRDERQVKIDYARVNYLRYLGGDTLFSASAGYHDEMFAGLRGQWYLPKVTPFMDLELALDWLTQREIERPQALGDYDVVSALAGVHFHSASRDWQLSLYGGDFLAKDRGVRLEFGHRFNNGVKLGGWYSQTKGESEVPGFEDPEYDNGGIFVTIPLASFKSKDTRKAFAFEYMPEIKDGGQKLHPLVSTDDHYWGHRQGPLKHFGQ